MAVFKCMNTFQVTKTDLFLNGHYLQDFGRHFFLYQLFFDFYKNSLEIRKCM